MTREEAKEILTHNWTRVDNPNYSESELDEAFFMAIEALQREIPKNPIVNYVADSEGARRLNDGWKEDSYLCPVCHTYFGEVFEEGYCRECGQKLIQKRVRVIEE